jgi:hypothetical protein
LLPLLWLQPPPRPAAGTHSLTLASAMDPAVTPQTPSAPQATEAAKPAAAPTYVDRSSVASTTARAATTTTSVPTTTATPVAAAPQAIGKASKPKRKRDWTEGRIISELHRRGIYW